MKLHHVSIQREEIYITSNMDFVSILSQAHFSLVHISPFRSSPRLPHYFVFAALDAATEAAVMSALRALSANRTTLIIAHRLSTVQHANLIVVLDKGKVVERGTHTELMGKGESKSLYARMWHAQAQAQAKQQQQQQQAAAAAASGHGHGHDAAKAA